jgi:hypothetical protein
VAGSRSGFCISVTTELDTSPASPLTLAVLLRGDLSVCVHAGGSTEYGAPGGAAVKASLGRAWSAARHCLAMPARYALGRLVSETFLFFLCHHSLAMLSDQLVKNSEPSSQILLCVAAARCTLVSVS